LETTPRPQTPKITVSFLPGTLELASWGPEGDRLREAAHQARLLQQPKTFNGPAVRIVRASVQGEVLELVAQRTDYFSQSRSNLAIDYKLTKNGPTLRGLLRKDYGAELPRLDDPRLANTLGVAALVLVRTREGLVPYLTSRSRDVAVFDHGGEWHCTASGVATLPESSDDASLFYRTSILAELDEEVGLEEGDLDTLEPVSFCREFGRAGKPQMFFVGVTSLDASTLSRKLKRARKIAYKAGLPVENTPMPLLRSPALLTDAPALSKFRERGFTAEGAAAIHYYLRCRDLLSERA
jgi:hypothetical protein